MAKRTRALHTVVELLRWCVSSENDVKTSVTLKNDTVGLEPILRAWKIDSLAWFASGRRTVRQQIYEKIWALQRIELLAVIEEARRANIRLLTFKGAELCEALFSSQPIGIYADVDLLVARKSISGARRLFYNLGFRQNLFDDKKGRLVEQDCQSIAEAESMHYELCGFNVLRPLDLTLEEIRVAKRVAAYPLRRIGSKYYVLCEFDIHHGITTDISTDGFFHHAVASGFDGAETLDPTDHLWVILMRFYQEVALYGKSSLRDLAYAARLLGKCHIDWLRFVHTALEYGVAVSNFYLLSFLRQFCDAPVPSGVLRKLTPSRVDRAADYGWQLGKLFGLVEPCPVDLLDGSQRRF